MTQGQFALLLDVTGATITNWERSAGSLRVLKRVRAVWSDLAALTPEEAQLCLQALDAGPAAGRSTTGVRPRYR